MPETASNLNSGDSFVLVTASEVFTWVGRGCAPEEVTVAEGIAEVSLLFIISSLSLSLPVHLQIASALVSTNEMIVRS